MKTAVYERRIIVMARLTDQEKEEFVTLQRLYKMSQAELIRWAVFNKDIHFEIRQEETQETRKKLLIQIGEIGNNLNQIARHLNSLGSATPSLTENIMQQLDELQKLQVQLSNESAMTKSEKKNKTIYLKNQ